MNLKEINTALEALKADLAEEIRKAELKVKGVTPVGNCCCSVNFSTIMENNFNLSAEWYMPASQKNYVVSIIDSSENVLVAVKRLKKMLSERKVNGVKANSVLLDCIERAVRKVEG